MTKIINKKGFTLIELMVVIVIIGILAAVAVPKFTMASHKAKASEFPTILTQIYTAENAIQSELGTYTDIGGIGVGGFSNSTYFSYVITSASGANVGAAAASAIQNAFYANANIKTPFGDVVVANDWAAIDQTGSKTGSTNLKKYVATWK